MVAPIQKLTLASVRATSMIDHYSKILEQLFGSASAVSCEEVLMNRDESRRSTRLLPTEPGPNGS
jgi:hypothetical protein